MPTDAIQAPPGFQLDSDVTPPAGFTMDTPSDVKPPSGFQMDPTDAANKELAKSGISVSAPPDVNQATSYVMKLPGDSGDFAKYAGRPSYLPPPIAAPTPEQSMAKMGERLKGGAKQLARGAGNIAQSGVMYPASHGPTPGAPPPTHQQLQHATEGAADIMEGTGTLAAPFMGEGLAAAPLRTLGTVALGAAASKGTEKALEHTNLDPTAKRALTDAAWFFPSALGQVVRPSVEVGITPEAQGGAFEAMGETGPTGEPVPGTGKLGFGVAKTPEGITVAGKVGSRTFSKTFGGKAQVPEAPAIEPPTIEADPVTFAANDRMQASAQAMANAQAAENPAPPPPPVPEPPPPPMVTDDVLGSVGQVIQNLPKEQQPAAILEATQRIEAALMAHGGAIVDGEVHRVDTPQEAKKVAQKIVNQQISAADAENKGQESPQTGDAVARAKAAAKKIQDGHNGEYRAQSQQEYEQAGQVKREGYEEARAAVDDLARERGETPLTEEEFAKELYPQWEAKGQRAAQKLEMGRKLNMPEVVKQAKAELDALKLGEDGHPLLPGAEFAGAVQSAAQRGITTRQYFEELLGQRKTADGAQSLSAKGAEATTKVTDQQIPGYAESPGAQSASEADVERQNEQKRILEQAAENPERRQNTELRKTVAEMSPEERAKALLTSEQTGLPNRRAFNEAEHASKASVIGISDADGLKALNDKYGYEAGNALLKAKAEALQDAGLEAYHDKGDEFLYRGTNPEELASKLEQARELLRNRELQYDAPDGKSYIIKGADFSYGTGPNLFSAEKGLHNHKGEREARGERKRGELLGIDAREVTSGRDAQAASQEVKPLHEMSLADFAAASERGRLHKATGKFTPEELKAKTPLRSGELAGYSPDDIAHFYVQRRGGKPGDASDLGTKHGYLEMMNDAVVEGRDIPDGPMDEAAAVDEELRGAKKGQRVTVDGKPGTLVSQSSEKLGHSTVRFEDGTVKLVPKRKIQRLEREEPVQQPSGSLPTSAVPAGESGKDIFTRLIDQWDTRDWAKMPPDSERMAVKRAYESVKPYLHNASISGKIRASKATTFADLRDALKLKAETPVQESGVSAEREQPEKVNTPDVPKVDTSRKTVEFSKGQSLPGVGGSSTEVKTPNGAVPAKYKVVEADSLVPSHNAETFAKNKAYPEGVQERAYHSSKEAQSRVIQQSDDYDPAYTVNTNPDAVNGPPVVTQDGIVLGGNSRAMATQRLYKRGNAGFYRKAILRQAETFGLDPAEVDKLNRPVLIREVESPKTIEEARRLGSDLNKPMTGALGVNEKAVTAGKSVSRETLNELAAIGDRLGGDASLRDIMREGGKHIVRSLVRDGVITDRERPQFVDTATGGLSEEGKTFVERALLGRVIDDPDLLERTPKSVVAKISGSVADIVPLDTRTDEYNLLPILRAAAEQHAEIARSGSDVETHLAQTGMFGPQRNPLVDTMVRKLGDKPLAVRKAFRRFAQDANYDQPGQGFLLAEPPTAAKAFNDAFGAKFSELEYAQHLTKSLEDYANGGTISYGRNTSANPVQTEAAPRSLQPGSSGTTQRSRQAGTPRKLTIKRPLSVGDRVVFDKVAPGSYLTPGREYVVESVGAKSAYFRDPQTGGGTSDPWKMLELAKYRKQESASGLFGSESGRSTAEAMASPVTLPIELAKKLNELYDQSADAALQKIHMGRAYPEVEREDPGMAAMLRQRAAAPQYYRAKAEQIIQDVVGKLSREQEKGFVLLADGDSSKWLNENHHDEWLKYQDDPAIKRSLKIYKLYEEQLRQARKAIGGSVIEGDYLRRVYADHVAGIGKGKGTDQAAAPAYDKVITPQMADKKQRIASPEYYYKHGLHEFAPAFATRYVGTMLKLAEHRVAANFISKATKVNVGDALPESVDYNGKTYFRPDVAKMIRDAVPNNPEGKEIAESMGLEQLPKPKDIKEYAVYNPTSSEKAAYQAKDLASQLVKAYENGTPGQAEADQLLRRAHATLHTINPLYLGPKDIVQVLSSDGRHIVPSWIRDIGDVLSPATGLVRRQVISTGLGIPHIKNILRRVIQASPVGATDPLSYVRAFRVIFDKELKRRALLGTGDEGFDRLLKHAAISANGIENYRNYTESNLNEGFWKNLGRTLSESAQETTNFAKQIPGNVRAAYGEGGIKGALKAGVTAASNAIEVPLRGPGYIGHKIIFGRGGIDQRSRLWLHDFIRSQHPDITDDRLAHEINDQLGRYNKAGWTDFQKDIQPFMMFPGWDYSSVNWVLKHPFRGVVPAAVLVLLANQILHRLHKNNRKDSLDLQRVHYGQSSFSDSLFRERLANAEMGTALRAGSSFLANHNAREAVKDALGGVPSDARAFVGTLNPFTLAPFEVASGKSLQTGREIVHNKRHPEKDWAEYGARKLFPTYTEALTPEKGHTATDLALRSLGISRIKKH